MLCHPVTIGIINRTYCSLLQLVRAQLDEYVILGWKNWKINLYNFKLIESINTMLLSPQIV